MKHKLLTFFLVTTIALSSLSVYASESLSVETIQEGSVLTEPPSNTSTTIIEEPPLVSDTIPSPEPITEGNPIDEPQPQEPFLTSESTPTPIPVYENEGVFNYIARLYTIVLDRPYDNVGMNDWYNSLINGEKDGSLVAYGFFFSTEYQSKNTSNDTYIHNLYKALFDREPDETGYNVWMKQLESNIPRIQVLKGFVDSEEFNSLCNKFFIKKGTIEIQPTYLSSHYSDLFVRRLYQTVLDREADTSGLETWKKELISQTLSGAEVAYNFFFSTEYLDKNTSNDTYLHHLYKALFNREPDQSGYNVWMEQLIAEVPRINILKQFVDSAEFDELCSSFSITTGTIEANHDGLIAYYSEQFVRHLYQTVLNRNADEAGLETWKNQLTSQTCSGAEITHNFIFSTECINQNLNNENFINMLYKAFFNRNADSDGKQHWLNILANGGSRELVFAEFANSIEFGVFCNKYGINQGSWNTRGINPNKPMIALTFDDGPSYYTPRILDSLEKNGQVATFFVVGYNAARYGSTMKRAYDMGCEIGNHSYNHPDLTYQSYNGIVNEMSSTNTLIYTATGANATICRTPGGSVNSTVRSAVGMPIILWSIDTLDWKTRDTWSTVNCVLNNAKDGDIILMHDIHSPTIAAAEILIPELVARGYQLVTVSELAQYKGIDMQNGTVYSSFR